MSECLLTYLIWITPIFDTLCSNLGFVSGAMCSEDHQIVPKLQDKKRHIKPQTLTVTRNSTDHDRHGYLFLTTPCPMGGVI
jgi:hypothetical protein